MKTKEEYKVKKSMYFIGTILTVIGITFGILFSQKRAEADYLSDQLAVEQSNRLIFKDLISYPVQSFEKKVDSEDLVFAYIGNAECPDCSIFYPVLEQKMREYQLANKLFYVEGSYLREDKEKWLAFKEKYEFMQTPAFIIYKEQKVVSKIEWDASEGLSEESFESWLIDNQEILDEIK
ncbi:thioredoxin family protein [Enterococcus sp. LJL128]|uniref:thioredoxin family protein n=1 Tax=Enterococcus sp. LJL51 TaxID=3416656 RepID=UPI003CED742B